MEEIKIIRLREVEARQIPGASGFQDGWIKRVIHSPHVDTRNVYMAILEVNPRSQPHPWHTHTRDRREGYEIVFPEDYVEIYHVIEGRGLVQWKTEGGNIEGTKVEAGDTIYFPAGVPEHQVLNDGPEKVRLILVGVPAPAITFPK